MAGNRAGRNFDNGECVKQGILPKDLRKKESEDFDMAKIRDYNMNGTIILGVDAGYGNYKTARCCFPTSVSRSGQPPIFTRNFLEYGAAITQ